MSQGQKLLTRRHLLTLAGGAVGVAVAGKALAGARRPSEGPRREPGRTGPRARPAPGEATAAAKSRRPAPQGTLARYPAHVEQGAVHDGRTVPAPVDESRHPRPATAEELAAHQELPPAQAEVTTPKAPGPVMRPLAVPAASATVAGLLGAVRPGTTLAGCRVVRVHDLHLGSVPVVLETPAGQRFQLDVLRRGATAGIAAGRDLSVFLANQGDGRSRTDERQGQAAMALATALGHQRRSQPLPRALLTLEQRGRRFPRGGFAVPLADA